MKKKIIVKDTNVFILLILAVAICGVMNILKPGAFLTMKNIQGMLTQLPEFGLISFGMMLTMIAGGIDLSLVGLSNLSGIVATVIIIQLGGNSGAILAGCAVGLLTGLLCGFLNGFLIGYLEIPAMIVTLCGLELYTGCGLMITKGPALTGLPDAFGVLGNGYIGGIPVSFIIFIAMAIIIGFIMKNTVFGRHIHYLGTNRHASFYSGIDNLKITIKTYVFSGLLGSIAGLIMISRYNSAKTDYGSSYTLLSLLISVLGGTSPSGGKGSVLGVTMAVIVLQLVSSAFNIMRVEAALKTFVWGLILIAVVIFNIMVEKYKSAENDT